MIPFQVNLNQSLDFRIRPPPKLAPTRIVGAPKLFVFPTKQALSLQIVVAATQFVHSQLQWSVINRTRGGTASPKLLDDLMSLFVRPGHESFQVNFAPLSLPFVWIRTALRRKTTVARSN